MLNKLKSLLLLGALFSASMVYAESENYTQDVTNSLDEIVTDTATSDVFSKSAQIQGTAEQNNLQGHAEQAQATKDSTSSYNEAMKDHQEMKHEVRRPRREERK